MRALSDFECYPLRCSRFRKRLREVVQVLQSLFSVLIRNSLCSQSQKHYHGLLIRNPTEVDTPTRQVPFIIVPAVGVLLNEALPRLLRLVFARLRQNTR